MLDEVRDRCGDLLSTITEKFDNLEDTLDRKMDDITDKLDAEEWLTPSSSSSRGNPISRTPQRPDRVKKRSSCPFCSRTECKDPVACGLRIKWTSRLAIHKNKSLCRERTCYKPHKAPCHKFNKVRCGHCNRAHIKLWCVHYAKEQGML